MKLKTPTFPRRGHHDTVAVAPAPPAPVAPMQYAQPAAPAAAATPAAPMQYAPAAPVAAAPTAPASALKKAAGGLAVPTRQRNAAAMIAGLAFIIIAGAMGASVASSFDDSIDVLVAAEPIEEGQPITADHFRVVQIAAGAGDIQAVAPDSIDDLVGRIAAGPIGEGSMIHPDQFALPFSDQQILMGAELDPNQYPAGGLKVGDQVRLIALAGRGAGGDEDEFVSGQEVAVGEIANVVPLGNGANVHYSIRIPESSANVVAQLISQDRISLGLLDESVQLNELSPLDPAEVPLPLTLDSEPAE